MKLMMGLTDGIPEEGTYAGFKFTNAHRMSWLHSQRTFKFWTTCPNSWPNSLPSSTRKCSQPSGRRSFTTPRGARRTRKPSHPTSCGPSTGTTAHLPDDPFLTTCAQVQPPEFLDAEAAGDDQRPCKARGTVGALHQAGKGVPKAEELSGHDVHQRCPQ